MTNITLLMSGGVDSLCGLLKLKKIYSKVTPLFIATGINYNDQEYLAFMKILKNLGISSYEVENFTFIKQWEKENSEVPFRNLTFLIAAAKREKDIAICIEEGTEINESKDRSYKFWKSFSTLLLFIYFA